MVEKKVTISYDMEEDIIHFFTGEKVKDSIEIGDFVFDISHSGKIVGFQISNASKFISKEYLPNIKEASMSNIYSREMVYIRVVYFVQINKNRIEKEFTSYLPELVVTK